MYDLPLARLRRVLPCLLLLLGSGLAEAANVDIGYRFRPSPNGSDFTNTTAPSGFCLEYAGCGSQITSVAVPVTYDRTVLTGLPAISRRWSLQAPPQAAVTLLADNGAAIQATFQITHLAQVLGGQGFDRQENPASHSGTGGNCSFVAPYGNAGNQLGFIWRMADPASPGLCYPATAGTDKPREITVSVRAMSMGYRLMLPASHSVKSGLYRGSVTYSVGEIGDLSLGSQVSNLSDSSVTFNFMVDVQHELSVTFAGKSSDVTLEPPPSYGGWQGYLTGQKPPPGGLQRNLPFTISTSGPFTLSLRCDEPNSFGTCQLRNARTQVLARILVYVTLPPEIRSKGGPFNRVMISEANTFFLEPIQPVIEQPGLLEIRTETMDFKYIMLNNPGYPFNNGITLVFDAQV